MSPKILLLIPVPTPCNLPTSDTASLHFPEKGSAVSHTHDFAHAVLSTWSVPSCYPPSSYWSFQLVSCVFLHEKPSLYLEFTSVIPLNTWKCNYNCIHICFPCQAEYKILESRNHVYSFWIQHLEHTQNWNIFLVDWQLSGSRSPFLRAQMLYLFWREYCGD